MLLSIDKFGHHFIKVDACVCLAAHFLHVELVLEGLLEAHDHVEFVSVHNFEDKQMGSVCARANSN